MSWGNRGNNLATDGFVGNFAVRPMTEGASALFWVFAGQRHDLTPLLGGQGGWCAASRRIGKPEAHVGFAPSGGSAVAPALFPMAHTVLA